ncbi:flagellar hook-associated family protein [Arvimicrobium flavum]|uniref:flagellar hook-associated family protein n=1 Tax=Arvimicrobium flavum TaxID=3393320 RepID=UPI00237A13A9|nr:flagellar hook-associated family protein [Mesorhizobium shangrilense]
MKTTFVSTVGSSQSLRYQLARMQSELVSANKEAQTFRVADRGLAFGARTSQSVTMWRDLDRLEHIQSQNGLVASRLTSTQNSLKQLEERAQAFLSTLTAGIGGDATAGVTRGDAKATLDTLTSILNTSVNGEYIFAGINTDVKPIGDYTAAGSPAKAAFDAAFAGFFGFPQSDPAAAGITAGQMDTFLTTVVEPQFLGAGWQANWSDASDEQITSRVALNETLKTSVTGNIDGIRKLAMAATTIYDMMSAPDMSPAAKATMLDRAYKMVSESIAELTQAQSELGVVQQQVTKATDRMAVQAGVLESAIGKMEGVDPYEASTRVTALVDQIELSYSLTARLQKLSLMKFL